MFGWFYDLILWVDWQILYIVKYDLYFRTVHVAIFILFKPTHALFLKHIHIHI